MRYSVLTLADAVSVREGVMNILSGGITILQRQSFPAPLEAVLAVAVEIDATEVIEHPFVDFQLRIAQSESGEVVHENVVGPAPTSGLSSAEGLPVQINLPIDLRGVALPKPGRYELSFRFSTMQEVCLRFLVIGPPSGPVAT